MFDLFVKVMDFLILGKPFKKQPTERELTIQQIQLLLEDLLAKPLVFKKDRPFNMVVLDLPEELHPVLRLVPGRCGVCNVDWVGGNVCTYVHTFENPNKGNNGCIVSVDLCVACADKLLLKNISTDALKSAILQFPASLYECGTSAFTIKQLCELALIYRCNHVNPQS